jgi:uncharacterized glyoxalase superfamily protein PhnB
MDAMANFYLLFIFSCATIAKIIKLERKNMALTPDGIGIVVSNIKDSLAFYRLLGFPIAENQDDEDHVECAFAGHRFMWDTVELMRSFDPEWAFPDPRSGQRVTIALRAETPEEVDAIVAQLWSADYCIHKAPWDAFWGQRYAQVCDPDGTHIDIYATLPESG